MFLMVEREINMRKLTDTFVLNNGLKIPCVGYGTWQTPSGEVAEESVITAIKHGYRHIDAAAAYGNEDSVGRGIIKSGIDRKELFVTSKVWNSERGYDKTKEAFEKTMENLGLDYLDLYLIHWPAAEHQFKNWEEINLETWRAMTELYKEGRIKAIGVCNCLPHHLKTFVETEVKPMINQIEFHPGYTQEETVAYCKEHGILVEAWSPLGSGRVLQNPSLVDIAAGYNKSVAQLCIRYCLQHEVLPLSKSVHEERIIQNADVFDFVISDGDMNKIDSLEELGFSGSHPDRVEF